MATTLPVLESVPCPYCGSVHRSTWASENGFTAVRCSDCAILYCNPRPVQSLIDASVRTGSHGSHAHDLVVTSRRIPRKVRLYKAVFSEMFADLWKGGKPLSWLDVGAGYGEVLEAVAAIAPSTSSLEGLEPMKPKAEEARRRGIRITEDYLRPDHAKVHVVSVVDVFSHVPNFDAFLSDVRSVLLPNGELFLETGNLADLAERKEFPYELGLPDHLVFAGERHVLGYLDRGGFDIVGVQRVRFDGVVNLAKNVTKLMLGRPGLIRVPYTSRYRSLRIRARLRG